MLPDQKTLLKIEIEEARSLLIEYIGPQQERFDKAFQLLRQNHPRISQIVTGAFLRILRAYPELLQPHAGYLLNQIKLTKTSQGKLRNYLRLLTMIKLDGSQLGGLIERCFELLANPAQPIAVRVFAIKNILNYRKEYPELINEIRLSVKDPEDTLSAGMKSILRKL